MGIFDNYFGKWIKVLDYQNNITIENYGYDTGIIEGTTKNHCVKCVAVNQCWFKDEINKKTDTTKIFLIFIFSSQKNKIRNSHFILYSIFEYLSILKL